MRAIANTRPRAGAARSPWRRAIAARPARAVPAIRSSGRPLQRELGGLVAQQQPRQPAQLLVHDGDQTVEPVALLLGPGSHAGRLYADRARRYTHPALGLVKDFPPSGGAR